MRRESSARYEGEKEVAYKALGRMKERVRWMTRRNAGRSIEQVAELRSGSNSARALVQPVMPQYFRNFDELE
jgi:hypothetical protein